MTHRFVINARLPLPTGEGKANLKYERCAEYVDMGFTPKIAGANLKDGLSFRLWY